VVAAAAPPVATTQGAAAAIALTDLDLGFEVVRNPAIAWRLPHGGPSTSDQCGQRIWIAHKVDDYAVHAWQVDHDCAQRDCGTCRSFQREDGTWDIRGWERREGALISEKWRAWLSGPLRGRVVQHVIVSPPLERVAEIAHLQDYRDLRDEAMAVARAAGVDAACSVFHPVRLGACVTGQRDGLRDGPHWHLIACTHGRGQDGGYDGETVAEIYDRTEWIVRWLGERESIYATAAYLLSHAGLSCLSGDLSKDRAPPAQTVTWWGYSHDWPRPAEIPKEERTRWCPLCKADIPVEEVRGCELRGGGPPEREWLFPPDPGGSVVPLKHVVWKRTLADEWREWRMSRFQLDYSGEDISDYAVHGQMPGKRED
jgi:hypothetical protein